MKRLLACLQIAAKYGDEICAEHDVVYFSGPADEHGSTPEEIEDVVQLEALGAHWSEDVDSWGKFV